MQNKQAKRSRRHEHVRAKIFGTSEKPRLYVFKSAKHIYAQLIDDEKGVTLASASDREFKKLKTKIKKAKAEETRKLLSGKVGIAYEVGKLIVKKAKDLKIEKVIFDRGGYRYHGRVRALAEGARERGLRF